MKYAIKLINVCSKSDQIIQKANEYQILVNFLLIDFQKAFYTVQHGNTWKALKTQRIGMKYKSCPKIGTHSLWTNL